MSTNEYCPYCEPIEPCGQYHVYVIELNEHTNYDFYVGQTWKTVGQRLKDNWEKYGSQGNGPKLIRDHFHQMRMDLVPPEMKFNDTREIAEKKETILADFLRDQGYRVKGPTARAGKTTEVSVSHV